MMAFLFTSGMTNLSLYKHWAVRGSNAGTFGTLLHGVFFPLKVTVVAMVEAAAVVDDMAETAKEATGKLTSSQ
jgi:hypothetical protein